MQGRVSIGDTLYHHDQRSVGIIQFGRILLTNCSRNRISEFYDEQLQFTRSRLSIQHLDACFLPASRCYRRPVHLLPSIGGIFTMLNAYLSLTGCLLSLKARLSSLNKHSRVGYQIPLTHISYWCCHAPFRVDHTSRASSKLPRHALALDGQVFATYSIQQY